MTYYAIGDLVDVWDSDVRRWVAGKVEDFKAIPQPGDLGKVFMMVDVDEPDPGPLAVNKVPSVYAIGDYGMVRKQR